MSKITDEIHLMEAIEELQAAMGDDLSEAEIDGFNYNIDVLLQKYHVTLDRYHEILLEEMEQAVAALNFSLL